MSKINKAYNNEALVEALKDRDSVYTSLKDEYDYSDEDLKIFNNLEKLSQFHKDLLYLSSKMSVYHISDLYGVSASLLYKHLREIQRKLHR